MFGRLLWQYGRQSFWLTAMMLGIYIALVGWRILTRDGGYRNESDLLTAAVLMATIAALMGTFVFLQDQSNRGYKFFVEHNVPPRYVWLSRQLPWAFALVLGSIFLSVVWPRATGADSDIHAIAIVFVIVSFAAGQWISMFVRSGIMAGFLGVLLASVLCVWVLIVKFMELDIVWSLLPIPLVLMFATWLRAPDWIRENTSWRARVRAAVVVLVPVAVLCTVVAIYRVHQIPLKSPGFEPEQFLREITPEALAVGDLYRKAGDSMVGPTRTPDPDAVGTLDRDFFSHRGDGQKLSQAQSEWLNENRGALQLLLQAAEQPRCFFENPAKDAEPFPVARLPHFIPLIVFSGVELEEQGKYTEAFDRYLAALRVSAQLASFRWNDEPFIFAMMREWGGRADQTVEQLTAAIAKVQAINSTSLPLAAAAKSQYVFYRRALSGDPKVSVGLYGNPNDWSLRLWATLMPWEGDRALRLLNWLSAASLARLEAIQQLLDKQNAKMDSPSAPLIQFELVRSQLWQTFLRRLAHGLVLAQDPGSANFLIDYFKNPGIYRTAPRPIAALQDYGQWMETTIPNLDSVAYQLSFLDTQAIKFETYRRATMIVLALQAYRLDHGSLPARIYDLVDKYLPSEPIDPATGLNFYFNPKLPGVAIGLDWILVPPVKDAAVNQRYQAIPGNTATPPADAGAAVENPGRHGINRYRPAPLSTVPENTGAAPPAAVRLPDVPAQPSAGDADPLNPAPPSAASPAQTSDDAANGPPRSEERP
jgi:hypothetical protein